jgi:hypothetical protein
MQKLPEKDFSHAKTARDDIMPGSLCMGKSLSVQVLDGKNAFFSGEEKEITKKTTTSVWWS